MRIGGEPKLDGVRVELVATLDDVVVASESLKQEREGMGVRGEATGEHRHVSGHGGAWRAVIGMSTYQAVPEKGVRGGDYVEQEAGVGQVAAAAGAAEGEQATLMDGESGEAGADHEGVDSLELLHGGAGAEQREGWSRRGRGRAWQRVYGCGGCRTIWLREIHID